MGTCCSYHTLVASLPHMPRDYAVPHVPISQPRLDERLKMLREEDVRIVQQLQEFFLWERQPKERTDQEMMEVYRRIIAATESSLVRDIVNYLMEVGVIVACLRRRLRGLPPPSGFGQLGEEIARHYQQPDFQLALSHPWVRRMHTLLEAKKTMEAHRHIVEVIYSYLKRRAEEHYFDFEAVILYVARWVVVRNWAAQDAAQGNARFEILAEEALGEYGAIFG